MKLAHSHEKSRKRLSESIHIFYLVEPRLSREIMNYATGEFWYGRGAPITPTKSDLIIDIMEEYRND